MRFRVPPTALIGLGLIVLGVSGYAGIDRWMNTRTVSPVNMPISLAAGHVRTGPFRLNLRADYWVWISPGEWWKDDRQCTPYPRLRSRWVLYQNGRVVDRQEEPTAYATSFHAGPGVYELDVEVLSDLRCLDAVHPHLEVNANTGDYESRAFALQVAAIVAAYFGLCSLVFVPVVRAVVQREKRINLTDSASVGQNFQWAQTMPLRRPISGLPAFGLAAAIIYATLAILMMLLTAFTTRTSYGWPVHLLKPGEVTAKSDTWTEPLNVRAKDAGPNQKPKLYVNSRQVAWEDLDRELKEELGRRKDWLVYVGGDDAVPWNDVTHVVDVARRYRAKVFLITGNPAP